MIFLLIELAIKLAEKVDCNFSFYKAFDFKTDIDPTCT